MKCFFWIKTTQIKYLDCYAEQNGVTKYIKFYHEVINITQATDYEKSGNWLLTVRNIKTNELFEETFNGVMVATGHHFKPHMVTFKGQEKFKGNFVQVNTC